MTADPQTPVEELEGRELDAAVASEVFELDVRGPEKYRGYWIYGESPFAHQFRTTDGDRGGDLNGVPYFCEEWGPAGRVVEKVAPESFQVSRLRGGVLVEMEILQQGPQWVCGTGDGVPSAICRAALRVVRD